MQTIANSLFGVTLDQNTLASTNYNFKAAQTIRLVLILAVLTIWVLTGFILVRVCPFYLSFWATTFLFLALLMTSLAAGRQVVEGKMKKKLAEESAQNGNKAVKEFPREEVSGTWKPAVQLYAICLPLVALSPVMFYFTDMKYDVLCQLRKNTSDSLDVNLVTCNLNLREDETLYPEYAASTGFRYLSFIC
jgi:hypothetical protein